MTLEILGWLAWGVLLVLTISATFAAIYQRLVGLPSALNIVPLLGWILLGWTYHDHLNKLHLFWVTLLLFALGIVGTTWSFILLHTQVPGFVMTLVGAIAMLWWLC